jgi:hypothetical protein
MLHVTRHESFYAGLSKVLVEVDGIGSGRLRGGEVLRLPLATGKHELAFRVAWWRSHPTTIYTSSEHDTHAEVTLRWQGGWLVRMVTKQSAFKVDIQLMRDSAA